MGGEKKEETDCNKRIYKSVVKKHYWVNKADNQKSSKHTGLFLS